MFLTFIEMNALFNNLKLYCLTSDAWSSAGQLSENYCRQHFLAALLLREVRHALLNEVYQVRRAAVRTLRDLMAKHELDARYQNKVGAFLLSFSDFQLLLLFLNQMIIFSGSAGENSVGVHAVVRDGVGAAGTTAGSGR